MHLKISETGEIEYASMTNTPLDIKVADHFFDEYPAFCWKMDVNGLVLKDDAEELKNLADAEKAEKVKNARMKELESIILIEVQKILDDGAKEKGYDSIISACSYMGSTNFGAEAQSFLDWRDAVWTYVYQAESDIKNGDRSEPTIEEFLNELPTRILP